MADGPRKGRAGGQEPADPSPPVRRHHSHATYGAEPMQAWAYWQPLQAQPRIG